MSDSPSKDSRRIRRAVPGALIGVSLVCLIVSTRSLVGVPERLGITVFGFFQTGFSAVGNFVSDTVASIAELHRLRADYQDVAKKLEQYTNMERGLADLQAENRRLKAQLGVVDKIGYERISARIVAKDPANLYPTILIDKGIDDGIRKDMPVVAFQDGVEGLVGRVLDVGHGTSVVVPVFDQSFYVAARLDRTRHEGLVGGSGSADEALVMRYVKKSAKDEIQYGDLVVTSGYDSIYPPDIAIGRIRKIRDIEYQTSIELDLDPVLDFSRLEYVFVIRAVPLVQTGEATP